MRLASTGTFTPADGQRVACTEDFGGGGGGGGAAAAAHVPLRAEQPCAMVCSWADRQYIDVRLLT